MGGRKRSKDWHHRVPDFKLVYCGQKKSFRKEAETSDRRRFQVSVTSDEKDVVEREAETAAIP